MSHAKNKVEWCLNKAQKELKETGKHRGLVKIQTNMELASSHLAKADHNLKAAVNFAKTGYSDWSVSAFFYSTYQCFLAIAAKFGYVSGNQECTFVLMYSLIEDKKIDIDKEILDKVTALEVQKGKEITTSTKMREEYQYGTELSIDEKLYEELFALASEILENTKKIMQK